MLAKSGKPFDSDEHLFEIKWDGTRGLARVSEGEFLLYNRRLTPMIMRYPELEFLAELEPGCIVDGEVVVMVEGKPSFPGMLKREQARTPEKGAQLARSFPATYVAFDLLYRHGQSITAQPLSDRRAQLKEVIAPHLGPHLAFSDGIVGAGTTFCEHVDSQGLEGVVAKRLNSRYLPGKRSDSWLKIKRSETIYCLILGYKLTGNELRSLAIATEVDGQLEYVGSVGSGIDTETRDRLMELLRERPAKKPIIPCPEKVHWVQPGLFCMVSYLERSASGELRAPVFKELLPPEE